MKLIIQSMAAVLGLALSCANAATYRVGPGQTYSTLDSALNALDLQPGDIVEVDGDTEYSGGITVDPQHSGTPEQPVIIRGLLINGNRPHFIGGVNTLHNRASNITFDGLEISGTGNTQSGTFRCFFHQGTGVTITRSYIHDCPRQGILGADQDSGSLTVEYTLVLNSGSGGRNHAIYMATDQVAYPGSTFRLQYSYISDSQFDTGDLGGNLIKSRAERNEIYYNWLEGGFYHELELIGPDPGGAAGGWSEGLAREDSDIVGNVIVHSTGFGSILRFGGDATGQSNGRYRFVHNTVIRTNGNEATVFRLFDGIASLQASNNIFFNAGGSALRMVREVEANWLSGSTTITGQNNWIENGSSFVPDGFSSSIFGSTPGFANLAALDFIPAPGSPVVNQGTATATVSGYAISNPLNSPQQQPPSSPIIDAAADFTRPSNASIDIGAFELQVQGTIFFNGFEG